MNVSLDTSLPAYILDTSAIMAIPSQFPQTKEAIWRGITQLIQASRLKSIQIVLDELERNAELANGAHLRLAPLKEQLLIPWDPLLSQAGHIADAFNSIAPANNPREKADPLIIAAAMTYGFTVICNESRIGRKMPRACDHFHVHHRNIAEFVRDERLEDY